MRDATQNQHAELERLLGLESGCVELLHYVAVLRCFHAVYAHLEVELAGWTRVLQPCLDWPARQKLPLLSQDLRDLGAAPATVDLRLSLQSEAGAWGCLYVLEGATLGGQIILGAVRHLRVTPEWGAAFFAGYGVATGWHWRTFCVALDAALQKPEASFDAVQTARATFELFSHAWNAVGTQHGKP